MTVFDPMLPAFHRIQKVWRETSDVFTMDLKAMTHSGSSHLPGQFNMLYVHGVGEVPASMSGDAAKPNGFIHTIRAVGAVTKAMQKLKRGDMVGVRGPFGSHWPLRESTGNDVVLIAGGIGLAPLRPALYALLADREKYGKVILLYGTRTPTDIVYRKELEAWRARFDLEISVTVDHASDVWKGNVGFVTSLIRKASFDPPHTTAFLCGPEVMMRYSAIELLKRGVDRDQIYFSMERNMKCAVGFCGHCQFGPTFVCKDGPIFAFSRLQEWLAKGEI